MRTKRILIVEDDLELLQLFRSYFTEPEWSIEVKSDGRSAAKAVVGQHYDVLLIDYQIPIINGVKVAAAAEQSKLNGSTPVFMVAGSFHKSVIEKFKSSNIKKCYEKPYSIEKILDDIGKQLSAVSSQKKHMEFDADLMNVFLNSVTEVMCFYFNKSPMTGELNVRPGGVPSRGAVSSIIEFNGDQIQGSFAISMCVPLVQEYLRVIFIDSDVKSDIDMVRDLVGEICSQVSGKVRCQLMGMGIHVNVSLPSVLSGKSHIVEHMEKENPVFFIPIGYKKMGCDLEFCFQQKKAS